MLGEGHEVLAELLGLGLETPIGNHRRAGGTVRRTSPYAVSGGSLGRPVGLFLGAGEQVQARAARTDGPCGADPVQPEACSAAPSAVQRQ